jgi:hypothetical protein
VKRAVSSDPQHPTQKQRLTKVERNLFVLEALDGQVNVVKQLEEDGGVVDTRV